MFMMFCGMCLFLGVFKICATGWFGSAIDRLGGNQVDHLFKHRINSSIVHASDYLKQFPSSILTIVAKFISIVSGGFAAVLIIIAFLEESILEGHIFGRNLFWYAAVFGNITAISQAAMVDEILVLDPQGAMSLIVQHTHYMPKRWRVKENTETVRLEFETLFQDVYDTKASHFLKHDDGSHEFGYLEKGTHESKEIKVEQTVTMMASV